MMAVSPFILFGYDAYMPALDATDDTTDTGSPNKRCFVVSAFGETPEEQTRTKQVLRHLVRKVLVPRGYHVVRADEIDEEGLITNQIIEHLLEDDLVIADLTGSNPNVFYEVAVRHAAGRPIIHLMTSGETIPFDVSHMRAVPYALDDPDLLEEAQDELGRKVAAIEESGGRAGPNPITVGRDVAILRDSDTPELREAGDLLGALNEIRDQVRSLARRSIEPSLGGYDKRPARASGSPSVRVKLQELARRELATDSVIPGSILEYLLDEGPTSSKAIAFAVAASPSSVSRYIRALEDRHIVSHSESDWDLSTEFRRYIESSPGI